MKTYAWLLLATGFLVSCAQTDSKPGSALSIEGQDQSTMVPGNATPIADRMGVEGSQHYHRRVTTEGLTPLSTP